jgi:hypothetical protein
MYAGKLTTTSPAPAAPIVLPVQETSTEPPGVLVEGVEVMEQSSPPATVIGPTNCTLPGKVSAMTRGLTTAPTAMSTLST